VVYVVLACRGLTGMVFLVSVFSKVRSGPAFRGFEAWLAGLPVPAARSWPGPVAVVMTAAEAAIVVLVALPWTARAGLVLAAAVLAVFTAGTWLAVARGADQPCQCFGTSASPLTRRHVVRDALLCAVAAAGAVGAGSGGARPAGLVVSLATGLAVALPMVFLDDLAGLFTATGDTSPDLAPAVTGNQAD
jgi:hypothetical protein